MTRLRRIGARPFSEMIPRTTSIRPISGTLGFRLFELGKLFQLERGDFHFLSKLEPAEYPTVSRIATNNGILGFYKKPSGAHIYPPNILTVSTVSGDAFLQFGSFMSTDNVVMCVPKREMRLTTLFLILNMMNRMKWRYSYGRQCYKTKLAQIKVFLPAKGESDELDEEGMEDVVKASSYWDFLQDKIGFPVITVKDFGAESGKKAKIRVRAKRLPLEAFASSE